MKMRYVLLGLGFLVLCYFAYVLNPTPVGEHPSTLVWLGRWTLGHMAQDLGFGYTVQGAWNCFQALFTAWALGAIAVGLPPVVRHLAGLLPVGQESRDIAEHHFVPAGGWTLTKVILTLSLIAVVIAMIGAGYNFYRGMFFGDVSNATMFPWMIGLIVAVVLSVIAVNLDWLARRHHVS